VEGGAVTEVPEEKRVSFTELFFDLVFVFAVTQVSGLLHDDHSAAGVARALILFVPIYWAWVGTTIHANTHDVDNPLDRIGVFSVALASLFMALAVPDAYGDRGLQFGAAYLVLRVLLAALVFRGAFRNLPVNAFSVGVCVTGPLLVIGGLVDGPARVALWATAATVDLLVPRLVRSRLARIRFESAHLPERFGLFMIIALGESVVAVGLVAAPEAMTAARMAAVAAAFVVACGVWWVYFGFAASAVRHALTTAAVQTDVVRSVFAYGHLLFIAGIVAVAVGLAEVAAHPTDRLPAGPAALLCGGTALYLAAFGYTRWRMFRKVSTTRLGAAAACLLLLPLAPAVPGLVTLTLLAVVLVALNVLEAAVVRGRSAGQAPSGSAGTATSATPN
jgi:low temperature requirement protein LtrA